MGEASSMDILPGDASRRLKSRQRLPDQRGDRCQDSELHLRRAGAQRLHEFLGRRHALLAFECQLRWVNPPVESEIDLAAPRVEYGYE